MGEAAETASKKFRGRRLEAAGARDNCRHLTDAHIGKGELTALPRGRLTRRIETVCANRHDSLRQRRRVRKGRGSRGEGCGWWFEFSTVDPRPSILAPPTSTASGERTAVSEKTWGTVARVKNPPGNHR